MRRGRRATQIFSKILQQSRLKKKSCPISQDKIDIGDELVGFLSAAAARNLWQGFPLAICDIINFLNGL